MINELRVASLEVKWFIEVDHDNIHLIFNKLENVEN